jgi:DNA modification methylase
MVFTDPPYNVNYEGGVLDNVKKRKIINDRMKSSDFYSFLFNMFSAVMIHVEGSLYVCMSSSELHNLWKAFTDAGGHWQEYIIWAKDHFTLSRTDYQQQFEPIMYGLTDDVAKSVEQNYDNGECDVMMYGWVKHEFYGGRKQGNVWNFDRPKKSKEHPTMKPVMLCAKAIVNSSKLDGVVLDVFCGSGSTLIACEKSRRICYGMELTEHYCSVIIKRWQEFSGQKAERIVCGS